MKRDIMKPLLLSFFMTVILAACSEDDELKTCVVQKVTIQSPDNYQLIEYNANGTIASVKIIFGGVESHHYDYSYASDKISIYLTDLAVSNQLAYELGLDSQGRMVSRTEDNVVYESYVYSGDRLDHIMWPDKDSIAFLYSGTNKNPDKSEFYEYNSSDQTWTLWSTTTFTFDGQPNPLKGLFLPFNHDWKFFFDNNQTSYSSGGESWYLTYTYNAEGYPVSRTLTSNSQDYTEVTEFSHECH